MTYYLQLTTLLCCLSFFSCQKEAKQHDADIQLIKDYIAANNIPAVEDTKANYFYHLYSLSTDSISPKANSALLVEVNYKAYLLDGTVVHDTNGTPEFIALDNAVYGWQLAMPKMHLHDKMLLFLPSRLAYGTQGNGNIPADAVVVFDIELIDVFPHF